MSTTTPNMGLIVPGVGTEVGPNWANEINGDLSSIDQHNHTTGQGVPIPVSGLNINSDFPMNGYNLVNPRTVRFEQLLTAPAASVPDVGVIYAAKVSSNYELFYNDTSGNQVQITTGGAVNATSSGITGPGGASASFSGGILVVDGSTNTPGNIKAGSILFGNNIVGSNFATVSPPAALGANYNLTLPPTNATGQTAIMTIDTSNNMGEIAKITNSNIANQTITATQIANNTITTAQTVVRANAATSSFNFSGIPTSPTTIATLTQTFAGGPCYLGICAGTPHFSLAVLSGSTSVTGYLFIYIDGGTSYGWDFNNGSNNNIGQGGALFSCPGPLFLPAGLSAGSHTITLVAQVSTGGVTISLSNAVLYINEQL